MAGIAAAATGGERAAYFRPYLLEPGDSISLDSTTPHRLANAGDTPVHAIWFVLGLDGGDEAHQTGGD